MVDDAPCATCNDTGITIQTERPCSCAAGLQFALSTAIGEPVDGPVTVQMVETVSDVFGNEPGEPFWRIEIDTYCADFDHEQAATNFAAAINRRLAALTQGNRPLADPDAATGCADDAGDLSQYDDGSLKEVLTSVCGMTQAEAEARGLT